MFYQFLMSSVSSELFRHPDHQSPLPKNESLLTQMSNLIEANIPQKKKDLPNVMASSDMRRSFTLVKRNAIEKIEKMEPSESYQGEIWITEPIQNREGTSENEQNVNCVHPNSIGGEGFQNYTQQQAQGEGSENWRLKRDGNKNQTKNIPKNFGKAIIIFIQKNRERIEPLLLTKGIDYEDLVRSLKPVKRKMNTIADLRNLWGNSKEGNFLRIISHHFLRKHSLKYIYNSRIQTRVCHTKYKKRLQQALKNPEDFSHIKQY